MDFATPAVARILRRQLKRAKVEVHEHVEARSVEEGFVELPERRLAFDVCVWCGRFETPQFVSTLDLPANNQARLLVDPWLRSIGDQNIYVAGDSCLPQEPVGAPPRMSGFFALTTGTYIADALTAERKRRRIKSFSFATYGQAIQFGRTGAGFASFPRDWQIGPIYTGWIGYHLRQFFVSLLFQLIKWHRRAPGLPFCLPAPGLRRARWPRPEKRSRARS